MPNEQTSVPLYASGEVLTASNLNLSAGTGVPVFATTVTRDAAFGGANEKVLAEGQLCYLSDTNIVQYYDGAAWATVGPATPGALVLVKSQAIGTTVSSVAVTDAFNATYETYKVVISGATSSSTSDALNLQLGSTTTNYYSASVGAYYDSGTGSTNVRQSNNGSNFKFAGGITSSFVCLNIDIINPQVAEITTIGAFVPYYNSAYATSGYLNDSTQYTGFTIIPATGTITGGTIYVYGYAKA
jgi:hypothetical protein